MIESFAKKVDLEVPEKLRDFVVAFIFGETDSPVQLNVPVFSTGFPLLVNIYNHRPGYTVNGKKYELSSNICTAGQIYNADITFQLDGIFGQIGIILHPTTLYYLFRKPGIVFTNRWTSLQDATEKASPCLNKDLEVSCSNAKRFDILLKFLEMLVPQRLPAIPWLDQTIKLILEEDGLSDHEQLIKKAGISPRHFRRIFKNIIGVPPKYFCKVIQLNTVFDMLKNGSTEKIHLLALDCGYYDQAHFIKDFVRLMRDTPQHFLKGEHNYIQNYMGRPENNGPNS